MTINNDCVCAGQIGMTNRCKIHPDPKVKQIADWQTGVWDMIKEKTMTVKKCKHNKWWHISNDFWQCLMCDIKLLIDNGNLIEEKIMTNKECDVNLGDLVVDRVSGFKGVAVARHIYLYGCDRITVQPVSGKKGKYLLESKTFDEPLLHVIEEAVYIGRNFAD